MEDIHVFVCLGHTGRDKRKFEQCHYKEIQEDRYLPYLTILWDLDNERKTKAIKVGDIGSKIKHFFSRFKKVERNGAHNKVEVYEIFFIKGRFRQHKSRDTRIRLKNILEIINVVEDLWRLCITRTLEISLAYQVVDLGSSFLFLQSYRL